MIKPQGKRYLVKPSKKVEAKLDSGLLVDEAAFKAPASLKFEVVARGDDCTLYDVGQQVLVAQWAPTEAKEWPTDQTFIVVEDDILAVIVPATVAK